MARAAALVIAFLALSGIAHSGTIVIGTPTADTGSCLGCLSNIETLTPFVTVSSGVINIDASVGAEFEPIETLNVTIPITIDGSTGVALAFAPSFSASGYDCGDPGCSANPQAWQLDGMMLASATLSSLDLEADANGLAPGTCGYLGIPELCTATVALHGSASGEIQLAPGTYDLAVSLEGYD